MLYLLSPARSNVELEGIGRFRLSLRSLLERLACHVRVVAHSEIG